MYFHHKSTLYNLSGDAVMKVTEWGGNKRSASMQPLKTQRAVHGAESVQFSNIVKPSHKHVYSQLRMYLE